MGPEPRLLRIAAVSELLGLPIPTIRSWERRYGFPSPSRTEGSHRRYSLGEIEQLRALRDLITSGHATREAVELVRRSSRPAGATAADASSAVVDAARRLDPAGVRSALEGASDALGVDETIRTVLLPAMHEIGAAWATGECDVGREHLATDAVRAWLGRQAFLAPPPFRPRPVVLACGPDEQHSIGLEAFATILARRGWPSRMLGARSPTDAVVDAVRSSDAVGAVVTAQRAVGRRSALASVAAVRALAGRKAFFAGAAFDAPVARRRVSGVYLGPDVVEAAAILEDAIAGSASAR
jgi:MerR family transcriptional regulator, light-induced transcriptional regulator